VTVRRFAITLALLLSFHLSTTVFAQRPSSDETAIRATFDKQAADWNRGDLTEFATAYKNSPDILFIGSKISRGYAQMLERYGATTTQEQAFYKLLDELVTRSKGREQEQPTFGYFTMQLAQVFPALKNDRDFIATVIDTLKIERPVYQELHTYMIAHGWPAWG